MTRSLDAGIRRFAHRTARKSVLVVASALCGVLGAATARAQSSALDIQYQAPTGCPGRTEFLRQIRERLSKPVAGATPSFRAQVTLTNGAAHGRLVIVSSDGTRSVRDVPGQSCAEVVEAMALISALTLDPDASTAPLGPHVAVRPRPVVHRPRHMETPRERWRFELGMRLSASGAIAPGVAAAVEPFVGLEHDTGRVFAPELRLAVLRSAESAAKTNLGVAGLVWTAARLSACPVRWPPESSLFLSPCALFDAGVLQGRGRNTHEPRNATAAWIAPGLAGRVVWQLVRPLSLELEGGATFPLERDSFFFAPRDRAFKVPVVGAIGSIGLTARLP